VIDAKATGKAATIKAMDDSFDYGTAVLKEQTDQTMVQGAAMPPGFLGPSTRARMFTFLIGHTWDIYGQMAVYLRLSGVTPPASVTPRNFLRVTSWFMAKRNIHRCSPQMLLWV